MIEGGSGAVGRSTAIVLFTDLVGSTELRSRLGEEAAEQVRRKHDRLMADVIEASRGHLVKNLGDGVMATFAGASDAVAAAIAVQQAIDHDNRSHPSARLEVRVGVSAGDVSFEEDGDCFGTPVIEAARLCATSRGGQILVSEVVRLLAGSGGGHSFTPVGALELKGLPHPVPAFEVAWEALPSAPVPLPGVLTVPGRIFVGRDEELTRLRQCWKEVRAGERRLVLMGGEPGVGKTRLAAQLARELHTEGGLVLAGRCDEDLGVPYQPFVEALRQYVSHIDEARLGRYAGELVRLIPELPDAVPGLPEPLRSDPETERYRLFDAVAAWLGDASSETPILLVLDDLHWAAKPTLLLLRHILRFPAPLRMLAVATYRDSDIGRRHPLAELLSDVRRFGGTERLPITGLDVPAVAAFLEQAAGHALGDEGYDLARVIWRETEGNALFVAEVLRHLTEAGALEERDGRWVLTATLDDVGIPEGVRDVVGRRLCRLSETTNRALSVASVVGLEFEPAIVAAASGLGDEQVLTALDDAISARLVVDVPGPVQRNRFAHALVRLTLYEELNAARRLALHRRVAEAIEAVHGGALDDDLPALAHHWARAAAPAAETGRAVHFATRAGDRALAQLAHDEAAAYYRQALDLMAVAGSSDEARRLDLLISLGEAQRRAGDAGYRETLFEAARLAGQRGDAEALARAALANSKEGTFGALGVTDEERVAGLQLALDTVGRGDSVTRARLLARLGLEVIFSEDRDRRLQMSDEALAMARRLGDDATIAEVLIARVGSLASEDNLQERLDHTAELIGVTDRIGDPTLRGWALIRRAMALLEAGDRSGAEACHEVLDDLVAEPGLPVVRFFASLVKAPLLVAAGRLDEAERRAATTLSLGEAAHLAEARPYYSDQLCSIRYEQGRLSELQEDLARRVEAVPVFRWQGALLALLCAESGETERARRLLVSVANRDFADIPSLTANVRLMALVLSSAVCAELGDRHRARLLHPLLVPYADQMATMTIFWFGSVSHHLGLLARTLGWHDEADVRFAAAAAAHERAGAPGWLARTRLEWAQMLLARSQPGDEQQARALLDQALTAARELGLAGVERRALHLLT